MQVLEEIAARWAAVAVAVSVHSLSCHPLLMFGTDEQRAQWLPGMLSGAQIGAYSLSEPQAGSDAAALQCKATRTDAGYVINGSKAWITHGGRADFYTLFARTGEGAGSRGISCFLVPGDQPGLSFGKPEEKMGLAAVPTTSAFYDNAVVDAGRRIGAEGQGLQIAFSALDSGRLGIAAVAVGIAQAALDELRAALRVPGNRARPLVGLARACADGLDLHASDDPAGTRARLLALPGIGPWTADYLALRATGLRDAFPAGDLVLRQALGMDKPADVEARARPWSPWRAFAAQHLWTATVLARLTRAASPAPRRSTARRGSPRP